MIFLETNLNSVCLQVPAGCPRYKSEGGYFLTNSKTKLKSVKNIKKGFQSKVICVKCD